MDKLAVAIVSIALFAVLTVSMGLVQRQAAKITALLAVLAFVLSSVLYGCCYAQLGLAFPEAVLKTLDAVIVGFLGNSSFDSVAEAPLVQSLLFRIAQYIAFLLSVYVTISAVLTAIAMKFVRRAALRVFGGTGLDVIYGVNEQSIAFGRQLAEEYGTFVVFADDGQGALKEDEISAMGAVLFSGEDIPGEAFVKRSGIVRRRGRVRVYCLSEDTEKDLVFAENLAEAISYQGIDGRNASLTLLASGEDQGSGLLFNMKTAQGYGSVTALNRADLAARTLIKTCPPYSTLSFENGRATEDFRAMIIGFGSTGQAVLRSLIMNGQFVGSRFSATVVSLEGEALAGSFFSRFPAVRCEYDIKVLPLNARSPEFFKALDKRLAGLKYIAVCTGSKKENSEIALELSEHIKSAGSDAVLAICHKDEIHQLLPGKKKAAVYTIESLRSGSLDRRAMLLNHSYCRGFSAERDWAECDYFSRMSCRAAADYMDAVLAASGCSKSQAAQGEFAPQGELLENLAMSEHLRWNAFHYAMGFQTMPEDVLREREEEYKKQAAEGKPVIRISKDMEHRLHACLVPWEELDALSERVSAASGKDTDYKQMDRDNILAIPQLLKHER